MTTHAEKVLNLADQRGVLRACDLAEEDIPRVTLTRLVRDGQLERVGRGLYSLVGADVSEFHALAEASRRVPHGVVCLLSALRFHELTTQNPFEVWLAIGGKARKPKVDYPPLRIVRFSERALRDGIDVHEIEKVRVPVTSPARTVADCFRYRNKIGVDVAIEALRDFLAHSRRPPGSSREIWTVDALVDAARSVRIYTRLRPYLEALV